MRARQDYIRTAAETALFCGLSFEEIERFLSFSGVRVQTYEKGDLLNPAGNGAHCLGFLLSGSARVIKSDGESKMLVSVLHVGDVFGAAALLSDCERYVANIHAMTQTRAVLIPESVWLQMLESDFRLAKNYIAYLTARIRFLSSRIDGFVKPTAEDRVLAFMQSRARDGVYCPETSLRAIGEALCISRTSLYRAFDALTASGRIRKEGRNIRFIQEEEK